MDTPISPGNPFSHTRHGFAWERVPADSDSHLDFGCYDGAFLAALRLKHVRQLTGVDASAEAIAAGRDRYPELDLRHGRPPLPLPFADAAFSSMTLLDVLEHVPDQKALLDELHRVLRPDGVLIITVPKQHVFSWLDRGNLKFRFPRLHRCVFRLRHTRAEYEHRYVSNPDGLVGDISAAKGWHEHFTPGHLAEVLKASGFRAELFDGSALFRRVTSNLLLIVGWVGPVRRLIERFERLDARRFASMNLFCLARKA
jgi:SAM-dependent methyltransferase